MKTRSGEREGMEGRVGSRVCKAVHCKTIMRSPMAALTATTWTSRRESAVTSVG